MRAPRLTTRRIMILVVICALASRLEIWRRRSPYCRAQATRCFNAAEAHLRLAADHERMAARYRDRYGDVNQATTFRLGSWAQQGKARRAAERGEAFRRAARYPWSPEPPEWTEPLGTSAERKPK